MPRSYWLIFGASTQVLFAITVYRVFPYLQRGGGFRGLLAREPGSAWSWLWVDGLLATQFAVSHSALLLPRVRKALAGRIAPAHYGCFFCTATCLSLLLTIELWQPGPGALWRLQGPARLVMNGAFLLSWVAMLYSFSLTGFGYQTGWTAWRAWARGCAPPNRVFEPRGAYRLLRHPAYLCFLGLVWLNPEMTSDRLTLALLWTTYIFTGSYLKDRRLVHYIGPEYQDYQSRVPGYPFIPWGPLARHPLREPELASTRA